MNDPTRWGSILRVRSKKKPVPESHEDILLRFERAARRALAVEMKRPKPKSKRTRSVSERTRT